MNETSQHDNDEAGRLLRMLEDVTAADGTHPDQDDVDAAGLREAWLAFGRLLEAADVAEPPPSKEPRKKHKPRRDFARAMAAAAAALCVALGLGWWLARDGRPAKQDMPMAVNPHSAAPQIVAVKPAPSPAAKKESIAAKPSSAAGSAAWDEGIETQITSVSQQIDAVEEAWQHRVDDADLVQYRIDEVSAGLNNDGL